MRSLLLHSLVLAVFATDCTAQWVIVDTSAGGTETITPRGPGGYFAAGSAMRYSDDEGLTWNPITPTSFGLPIIGIWYDAHFTDADNGVVAGAFNLDDSFIIMRTSDGGWTWNVVYDDYSGMYPRHAHALSFPSDQVGYACGTHAMLRKTVNGGQDWTPVNAFGFDDYTAVHFWDASTGLVLSTNSVGRTTNGGGAWATTFVGLNAGALCALDNGRAVVAADGVLRMSADFGATWNSHTAPFQLTTDAVIINDTTVLVSTRYDGIYVTRDNGVSWLQYTYPGDQDVMDLLQVNDQVLLAGGSTGFNGLILRTENNGGPVVPIASFNHYVTPQCGRSTVLMYSTASAQCSIEWTYNGVPFGTGFQVVDTLTEPQNTGTYAMIATIGDQTDTAYWTIDVVVQQAVVADAGPDVYTCAGEPALLVASGGSSYAWSGPGAFNADSNMLEVVRFDTTLYVVEVSEGACSDTDSVLVMPATVALPGEWTHILTEPYTISIVDALDGDHIIVTNNASHWITGDGGSSWIEKPAHLTNGGKWLDMVSPTEGWLVQGLVFDTCGLFHTTDAWTTRQLVLQASPEEWYEKVEMVNSAIGYLEYAHLEEHGLQRTDDGGETWNNVFSDDEIDCWTVWGQDTLIARTWGIGGPKIQWSGNGGQSWTDAAWPDSISAFPSISMPVFASANDVFIPAPFSASGPYGYLVSHNGGLNWSMVDWGTNGIGAMAFTTPDTGYARSSLGLLRTTDGGNCWVPATLPEPVWYQATYFEAAGGALFWGGEIDQQYQLYRYPGPGEITTTFAEPEAPTARPVLGPVPADDHITLRLPEAWRPARIDLFDAQGMAVPAKLAADGATLFTDQLVPGVYLVRVTGPCGSHSYRVPVMH